MLKSDCEPIAPKAGVVPQWLREGIADEWCGDCYDNPDIVLLSYLYALSASALRGLSGWGGPLAHMCLGAEGGCLWSRSRFGTCVCVPSAKGSCIYKISLDIQYHSCRISINNL